MFNFSIYKLVFLVLILAGPLMGILDFEKELVRGKRLIIGTVNMPPYTIITKRDYNGSLIQVDGFVHQIINFLAHKFEFTYEYVEPADGYTGFCYNDTNCNGLIGMLIRSEIDIAATGLALTLSRSQVIDFTFEFQSDPMSLLIPYPRRKSTIDGISDPFSFEVWVLILISLVVCGFCLLWIGHLEARLTRSYQNNKIEIEPATDKTHSGVGYFVMFLLSVLVNPGNRFPPGFGVAFQILVGAWCLHAVVVTNSYTTSVKSFLMMPSYLPVIRTLEDVVQSKEYSFVVQKYTVIWGNMMTATSGLYHKVGNSLRKYPEHSIENLPDDNDMVVNQKKILGQLKSLNLVRIENDMKTHSGECRLHIGEDFDETRISFGLPKDSPFLNHFLSHELMWIRQSGVLTKWANIYWPRTNRCSAPIITEPSRINEKLNLNYLSGAFLLLGVGITSSLVVFVLELLVSYRCRRKNRRQSLPQHLVTSPIAVNEYDPESLTCPHNPKLVDEDEQSFEPDENSFQKLSKTPIL